MSQLVHMHESEAGLIGDIGDHEEITGLVGSDGVCGPAVADIGVTQEYLIGVRSGDTCDAQHHCHYGELQSSEHAITKCICQAFTNN